MNDPRSFGAWLRRERERRSITLRAIADRTKIGVGLLEGLERGDVSRWPGGIYRRAFARAYASAIGLDADLVIANFERMFPSDSGVTVPSGPVVPPVEREGMRLALVTLAAPGVTALKTAGRDVACILAIALLGLAGGGAVGFWCAAAIAAIAFHVSRLLGLQQRALWRIPAERRQSSTGATGAEVVSFTDEHVRTSSRRARARRLLSDLSAAASSAALPRRSRAARS